MHRAFGALDLADLPFRALRPIEASPWPGSWLDTYSHVIEGMDGGLADAMDDAL